MTRCDVHTQRVLRSGLNCEGRVSMMWQWVGSV